MKVKIINRSVYHKYAEVFIEVPNNIECNDIHEYLTDNENLYSDKIDQALNNAEYQYGSGLYEYRGMDENTDSEWRFEYEGDKQGVGYMGGHL
tara:strand:+ start:733 stop:1011 length:279 start_codon:yes stop_codon:yes gene_type:complete